ncbi:hypothetical protein PG996_006719 [Apiospora saccharicola]|uniref:Uncharacterized protein n=1 Tax=Apiospora saccharicola TaxID=335842 RepID=A0ABR1V8S3_9PEZI
MSSSEETRFAHSVFVVREDHDEHQSPEFVDHPMKLDAVYKPSTSVLFRLSMPITDSAFIKTTIYLQITPDRISSLRNTTCDATDTSERKPSCLDRVCDRLGGARFVTRLQFQLHTDSHAQLVVPTDFNLQDAPDSPSQRMFGSVSSLAAASSFSLYMPHNVLQIKKFQNLEAAVRQFPALTAAQRHAFERMVDLRSLYHGKGGVVFFSDNQDHAASPGSTASDDATESDAATIPFDTPSRYRDSPPRYEECPSEEHKPKDQPDAAIVSEDSPAGDCAPPAYEDDDEPRFKHPMVGKRVLNCGSEDIDLRPAAKRRYARTAKTTEKLSLPQPTSLDCSFESRLQFQLERQRQQIERLQEGIKTLQKRNKELEGRHNELEESHGVLEIRQVETEEAIESILVHTGELDDECERLGKQVPDIGDEVEDWMKCNMGNTAKDIMADWLRENMSETIQEYITSQVTAQIAEVKTKMRSALGD